MRQKMAIVLVSTVVGMGVGGLLGNGPLLKYQSEGVLKLELGTAEYKRLTELANNAGVLRQFMELNPLTGLEEDATERLVRTLSRGDWSKPVPKLSKLDAKELPDLQKEDSASASSAYLGIKLSAVAHDPAQAAGITKWLGEYFKDAATLGAVRELVTRWAADNQQFADRALEKKIKMAFAIEQVQNRAAALKQLMARYPNMSQRESQQVLDVRKDNEKFMSPLAQLVAAESEIIGMQEDVRSLDREILQHAFTKTLMTNAMAALDKSRSGSESILQLAQVIKQQSKQSNTEAEQEKLLAFAADISHISARFLSQAQFIAEPSVPTRPQGLGPLKTMALMGFLAMLFSAAVVWRKTLLKLLQEGAGTPMQAAPLLAR